MMVFVSFFEQHVYGSTFAIVLLTRESWASSGNLFNLMHRGFGNNFHAAFLCQGYHWVIGPWISQGDFGSSKDGRLTSIRPVRIVDRSCHSFI